MSWSLSLSVSSSWLVGEAELAAVVVATVLAHSCLRGEPLTALSLPLELPLLPLLLLLLVRLVVVVVVVAVPLQVSLELVDFAVRLVDWVGHELASEEDPRLLMLDMELEELLRFR